MTFNTRRSQNKEQRESTDVKVAELRELRAENRKLKKELQQARRDCAKERRKFEKHCSGQEYDEFEPEEVEAQPEAKKAIVIEEDKCCSFPQMTIISMGPKKLHMCKNCKSKKII